MKKILLLICLIFSCCCVCACNHGYTSVSEASKGLSTYKMNIEYLESSKTLNVLQNLTYVNNENTQIKELYFHLYPKSFNLDSESQVVGILNKAKAYYNGESEGDIEINSIQCSEETLAMTYVHNDQDILKIEFNDPIEPLDSVDLSFEYVVTLPNCNHRFGYGENTINVGNFYPILAVYDNGEYMIDSYHSNGDPFYSDVANYEVEINVPEKYVIAATGYEEEVQQNEGVKIVRYAAKAVRDFAFVLSEKFEVVSANIEGVDVKYYYYDDPNFESNLQTSIDSLVTFNELFGEYPYSTLSVVKANFVHGGMEYPNLVYISDEVNNLEDYANVIIHEIAHQWWYGLVGNNEYQNSWLDEGLAEFSTVLFYEKNPSYNIDTGEIIKNITKSYTTFVDLYSSVLGEVDTSMNRKLNEYNTEPEYVYITYVKGNLLFNTLRTTIGQDKLIKALKLYFRDNMFKIATPEDLIFAVEKVCGMDMQEFFNSWILGKVKILENI
ncbi:MAG: M1 family metallopeptidase [Clostridia bacterium]|nr:M1 family metallopeptidase [Clostridia bacterium]